MKLSLAFGMFRRLAPAFSSSGSDISSLGMTAGNLLGTTLTDHPSVSGSPFGLTAYISGGVSRSFPGQKGQLGSFDTALESVFCAALKSDGLFALPVAIMAYSPDSMSYLISDKCPLPLGFLRWKG